MKQVRDSFQKSGYDQEEAYFHKRDQALIEKQRRSRLSLVPNNSPLSTEDKSSKVDDAKPAKSEYKKAA